MVSHCSGKRRKPSSPVSRSSLQTSNSFSCLDGDGSDLAVVHSMSLENLAQASLHRWDSSLCLEDKDSLPNLISGLSTQSAGPDMNAVKRNQKHRGDVASPVCNERSARCIW